MRSSLELHEEVTTFAEELRDWSIGQVAMTFLGLDLSDLRLTWPPIAERLIALHQGVVTSALDAVDGFMMLLALDAGFLHYVPWQQDEPERPFLLPSGASAERVIYGQIGAILYGISKGLEPIESVGLAERRVAGMIGSEPHLILRRTTRSRVIADMKAHGR